MNNTLVYLLFGVRRGMKCLFAALAHTNTQHLKVLKSANPTPVQPAQLGRTIH